MAQNTFATGDLVWAKMKSYPFWPAKVVDPPDHIKPPNSLAGKFCVCFFGSKDYAWVPENCIKVHTEERAIATKNKTKTSAALLKAIKEICDYENTGSPPASPDIFAETSSESKNDSSNSSAELSPTFSDVVKDVKREKVKRKLTFKEERPTKRTCQDEIEHVDKSTPPELAESSPDNSMILEETAFTQEPKLIVPKKCNFADSSSNDFVPLERDNSIDDLFASTSDFRRDSQMKLYYLSNELTTTVFPDTTEAERMEMKKRMMKGKFTLPEQDYMKHDLGLPKRHFYKCPPTPDIDMDKNNYLCDKDIKVIDKKIGFLGINQMSAGILKNLILSGHNVTVWCDNSELCQPFIEAGASIAETAEDVVASCDITIGYVGDINAVKQMMYANFGILKGLEGCSNGSKVYVEMTPLDVPSVLEFEKAFAFYGMKYMIAPVVGSRQTAEEGSLLCLASGDVELFTECYSCFSSFSRNVYYVSSELEAGVKMYLIHSMLIGTTTAAMAEAVALIKKCNLSFNSFYELIEMGPFSCQLALEKSNLMNSFNFMPNTILNKQLMDIKMGLRLANSCHSSTVVTAAAHQLFKRAKFLNYSDHDVSSVVMGTELELEEEEAEEGKN